MSKREEIKKELIQLLQQLREFIRLIKDRKLVKFSGNYQKWYTSALSILRVLAPDRLDEFINYYEADRKRKSVNGLTYSIQDYTLGRSPKKDYSGEKPYDEEVVVLTKIVNQFNILESLVTRIDSVISNVEIALLTEIQDSELKMARTLLKVNIRAAGSLAGVVLENHLQKVAVAHNIKIKKKNPTISDLNDPLKAADIIDTPRWRQIQFLADIRNLCSHKKHREPTPEEVEKLIDGTAEVIKLVI